MNRLCPELAWFKKDSISAPATSLLPTREQQELGLLSRINLQVFFQINTIDSLCHTLYRKPCSSVSPAWQPQEIKLSGDIELID